MTHPDISNHLKAQGNLSYQDFLRLVNKLWLDAHPGIPIIATGDRSFAQYPMITYRLDLRKAHPSEPKPKFREEIPTKEGEPAILISGQKFQSVVTFSATSENDPASVETLIEEFQDFMMEFTPVFKEVGLSEIVFMRRLPDSHDERPGEGIVTRSISYLVTTETLKKSFVRKLESVLVDARAFIATNNVTFETYAADPNTILVYGATFKHGDRVLVAHNKTPLPFPGGHYYIHNIITGPTRYTLYKLHNLGASPDYEPLVFANQGSGLIGIDEESASQVTITDTFSALGQ